MTSETQSTEEIIDEVAADFRAEIRHIFHPEKTTMNRVQFYAHTPPTLPAPDVTPYLQAFKEMDGGVTITVRGKNGYEGSIMPIRLTPTHTSPMLVIVSAPLA